MCSSKSSTTRTVNTETERLIFLFLSRACAPDLCAVFTLYFNGGLKR